MGSGGNHFLTKITTEAGALMPTMKTQMSSTTLEGSTGTEEEMMANMKMAGSAHLIKACGTRVSPTMVRKRDNLEEPLGIKSSIPSYVSYDC